MINFIVVTHGEFGAYLVEAAESVVGRQSGVRVVSISARIAAPEIREKISRAVAELSGGDGIILFADMPGGSPSNLSFPVIKDKADAEMITGVNLYMLVSAFSHRQEKDLAKVTAKVLSDGQRSICDVRKAYLSRAEA